MSIPPSSWQLNAKVLVAQKLHDELVENKGCDIDLLLYSVHHGEPMDEEQQQMV